MGIADLQVKLQADAGEKASRPTLLRRLNELIERKKIVPEGQARARVYKLVSTAVPAPAGASAEGYVPTSMEGGRIRDLVTAPR